MDFTGDLEKYAKSVAEHIKSSPFEKLNLTAQKLIEASQNKNWIYTAGNGGSASTASHLANDLVKGLNMASPRFKAKALNDSIPVITALANDYDYSLIYREQLKNYIEPGDIFIPISGSGNSPNVVKAAEYCQQKGIKVISFTGKGGGQLKDFSDICCQASTEVMEKIEDIHLMWEHALVSIIREHI